MFQRALPKMLQGFWIHFCFRNWDILKNETIKKLSKYLLSRQASLTDIYSWPYHPMPSAAQTKALCPKSMFFRFKATVPNIEGVSLISFGFLIGPQLVDHYFIHFWLVLSFNQNMFWYMIFMLFLIHPSSSFELHKTM